MQEWILGFAAVTGFSVVCFMAVAVLWLKRLRDTVSIALTESANQQVQTSQRFSEAIAQVQKQQRNFETQLQNLTQSNTQLRQGLVSVATQLQHGQVDATRVEPTIH